MKVIINIIGLSLGVIGALLIYIFGIPNVLDKNGANLIGDYGNKESKKKAKKYLFSSKIGITLLLMSFLLQLISNFLPN